MQISRTTLPQSAPKIKTSEDSHEPKSFKPLEEKWTVGDRTFDSTSDLLAHTDELDNVQATYHYRAQDKVAPFSKTEKLMNAAGSSLIGASAGAAVGAVAGAGLVLVDGAMSLLGALLMAPTTSAPNGLVAIPMALGAGIGAIAGARAGYSSTANGALETATGILKREDGAASFYLGGDVTAKVDLEDFNAAPTPPITPKQTEESSQLGPRLTAAALGAAAVPWSLFPILGAVTPPLLGGFIGDTLDPRTSLGTGLGVAAGVGATAASFGSMAHGGYAPYAVAGTLALGGAMIGKKLSEASNTVPAQRNYGDQWWNQQAQERERAEGL